MAEKVNPKPIIYGGVRMDSNQVASKTKRQDGTYEVRFKNGQSIFYKDQSADGFGEISYDNNGYVRLIDINGSVFMGSENEENTIVLDGNSKQNRVHVENNKKQDFVYSTNTEANRIFLGEGDEYTRRGYDEAHIVGPDVVEESNLPKKNTTPKTDFGY